MKRQKVLQACVDTIIYDDLITAGLYSEAEFEFDPKFCVTAESAVTKFGLFGEFGAYSPTDIEYADGFRVRDVATLKASKALKRRFDDGALAKHKDGDGNFLKHNGFVVYTMAGSKFKDYTTVRKIDLL